MRWIYASSPSIVNDMYSSTSPSHEFIFPDISIPDCHLQHHGWVRKHFQVKLFLPLWIQCLLTGFGFELLIAQSETTVWVAESFKIKR